MRFKALRHQPSDAARKSGYNNEGQLPDTLPDSRSRPLAVGGGGESGRSTFDMSGDKTAQPAWHPLDGMVRRRPSTSRLRKTREGPPHKSDTETPRHPIALQSDRSTERHQFPILQR